MSDQISSRILEADAKAGNARVRISTLALEILRNGGSLMTQAEAMAQAEAELGLYLVRKGRGVVVQTTPTRKALPEIEADAEAVRHAMAADLAMIRKGGRS